MTDFTWLNFCYYAGLAEFCVIGVLQAKRENRHWLVAFLCGISNTMYGGITRDVVILKTFPLIFTSPHEIIVILSIALLMALAFNEDKLSPKLSRFTHHVMNIADSLGVLAFVSVGCSQFYNVTSSSDWRVAILPGAVTALGGGCWATVFRGLSEGKWKSRIRYILTTLLKTTPYYIFVGIIAFSYAVMVYNGFDKDYVVICLTIPAVILGIIADHIVHKKTDR